MLNREEIFQAMKANRMLSMISRGTPFMKKGSVRPNVSSGEVPDDQTVYGMIRLGDSIPRGANDEGLPGVPGPTPLPNTVFDFEDGVIVQVTDHDVHDAEGTTPEAIGGSPWPQYGILYNAATGKKICFVPGAFGGSSISASDQAGRWWTNTGPGSLWQTAVDNATAFVAAGGVLEKIVIGTLVNDYRDPVPPTAAEAKIAYQDLINRSIAQWPGLPIYIFQVPTVETVNTSLAAQLRIVIMELIEENANVHLAINPLGDGAKGYISADTVHRNQTGNNAEGSQLFHYEISHADVTNKKIRTALSSFDTQLSTAHKAAVIAFMEGLITDGNFDAVDSFCPLVSRTSNNNKLDLFSFVPRGIDVATHVPNVGVSTNGTTERIRTGWVPAWYGRRSTQDDVLYGVKTGTITTASGTTACLFGTDLGTGDFYVQMATGGISYRVNDGTTTTWTTGEGGDSKFANDAVYAAGRIGTKKFLMKDTTEVDSATVTSTARSTRELAIGGRATGAVSGDLYDQLLNGVYEYSFGLKWSALTSYANFLTRANTLMVALKS